MRDTPVLWESGGEDAVVVVLGHVTMLQHTSGGLKVMLAGQTTVELAYGEKSESFLRAWREFCSGPPIVAHDETFVRDYDVRATELKGKQERERASLSEWANRRISP